MAVWRVIHEGLRRNAELRARLDVEEAQMLREAVAIKIWVRFGCVNVYDYLERELGYGPREARERLRVAMALRELGEIEGALGMGELKYSAVREVTRVAVAETEGEWLEAVKGKTLREVEEMVSGRRRGERPSDPRQPNRRLRKVTYEELSPETYALLRQARAALSDEIGEFLEDDRFLAMLCERAIGVGEGSGAGPSHQVAVTVCEECGRGWQLGGGREIEIEASGVERAECDAVRIGRVDAETPERAKADIPPATRRLVLQRDGGRCQVPGCRSGRALDLHHVVHREHGGGHEPSNLTVCCSAHHRQAHVGLLEISGRAPDGLKFVRKDPAAMVARKFEALEKWRESMWSTAAPSRQARPTWLDGRAESTSYDASRRGQI